METKQVIGGLVHREFEKRLDSSLFTEENFKKQIEEGSKIVEEKPFVTLTFRDKGIIGPSEGTAKIIHTFRPNIWAQDYAHGIGRLDKMTIHTAKERADASIEYLDSTSKGLHKTLKYAGKSLYDFSDCFRESAMIEAAYYTLLSGNELSKEVEKRIETAMMKRLISKDYDFRRIAETCGVDYKDNLAMYQFSKEMDIKEIFTDIVSNDPYFNRRKRQLDIFTEINSQESIKAPQTMTEKAALGIMERLTRKYPAMAKKVFNDFEVRV